MENRHTFMNLMTDFAFKRIFGSKQRKHLLIKFLNILFADDGISVEDVTYLDKEVLPRDERGKRILYDIYCTTPGGREHIIVEMQQAYHEFFEDRSVFYSFNAIAAQGEKGWKYDLRPVYSIFLVDFHFPHLTRSEFHDVRLIDMRSHEVFSDKLRMLFLHLNETKESWEKCETKYDKIMFLIKNMHTMDKTSTPYLSKEFEDLFREAEISNMVAEDAVAYSNSYQKYIDTVSAVNYAARSSYSKGREEGREEGIVKGREEGIVKGREEGIVKGREEGIVKGREEGIAEGRAEGLAEGRVKGRAEERAKSIRLMYEMGISVEQIAEKYGMHYNLVREAIFGIGN